MIHIQMPRREWRRRHRQDRIDRKKRYPVLSTVLGLALALLTLYIIDYAKRH